uniref:Uncharacterized protein n=1 Tax=Arundo donax TaxID=35708 RepID=A0A0A8YBU4_ARUDO
MLILVIATKFCGYTHMTIFLLSLRCFQFWLLLCYHAPFMER